jgi:hypothetical protein
MVGVPLVLLLLLPAEDKPTPKLPLGKETTYITKPLDKEGYIDYESALNDRLGKSITPEKNANVLIWKALGPTPEGSRGMPDEFFKRLGIDRPPEKGDYFTGLSTYLRDHAKLDRDEVSATYGQHYEAGTRPWAAKDYPHIAGWLKVNEKPLAVIVEATRRPEYFNPLVSPKTGKGSGGLLGALVPGTQKCRESAASLVARAMLRLGKGTPDDAWQDLLACHRLGRLVARGGTLTETLIGIAIDQIASNGDLVYLDRAPLTAKQAQNCLNDLRGLPPMPSLADKADVSERFLFLDSVQLVRRGESPEQEMALGAIDWEPSLRGGNRLYDRLAAALRIEDRAKREKEFGRIEEYLDKLDEETGKVPSRLNEAIKMLLGKTDPGKEEGKKVGNMMICLFAPAVRKVQQAFDRVEQTQRNLHLAFALAAYRSDRGRYPAKLDDLAPKYLAAIPDDLFSAKPLIYRPEEKGYLLYSVGVNGRDEGGHWVDDDPPGDDLRVRMPLPELKREK